MTLPDTEDLLLFGSLALAAIGASLITLTTTEDAMLALGVAFVVFAVPTVLITFLAAGDNP